MDARIDPALDAAVTKDFYAGILTNNQIAEKYHIGIRTIYNCVKRYEPGKKRKKQRRGTGWISVTFTRNEIELLLLLIADADDNLPERFLQCAPHCENKLLRAADRDEKNYMK